MNIWRAGSITKRESSKYLRHKTENQRYFVAFVSSYSGKAFQKMLVKLTQGWTTIVITKVSYSLVLSLLLSIVLSLSKVKPRQKINCQDHLAKWTDVNYQPKYMTVLHSLTLWKASTNVRYNTGQDYLASSTYLTSLCLRAIPLTSHRESLLEHCRCC